MGLSHTLECSCEHRCHAAVAGIRSARDPPGSIIPPQDLHPEDVALLLERFTVVPAATRSGGIPATGWARLAMAVNPLQGSSDAIVLVDLADGALIVIDWGRKDYWWQSAGPVPVEPTITNIRLLRGEGARLPYMVEEPDDLQTLLWHVGIHAFPNAIAWWFTEGSRYQLTRWPDFTSFAHEPDDVRMTALLGTAPYSTTELAAAAGVDIVDAQRLLNALSLMGLVRETPVEASAAPPPPPVTERPRGLFSRLRARLGR
ncbi:MAG: hypothetical protein ACOH1T_11890 [Microbacteriaceae bacterium]